MFKETPRKVIFLEQNSCLIVRGSAFDDDDDGVNYVDDGVNYADDGDNKNNSNNNNKLLLTYTRSAAIKAVLTPKKAYSHV